MYIRDVHCESSMQALRQIIRDNPLGIFTTAIDSAKYDFLQSSHIPFILDVSDESSDSELGTLRGHLARQNPQSKAMIEHVTTDVNAPPPAATNVLERDVLVLFTAGAHHYVTPKFYRETKPESGKVVPTWNYAAVQCYGRARVYVDAKADETDAFLQRQIQDLSEHNETHTMGHTGEDGKDCPWKVTDAPERYIDFMKKAILGVEIEITKMEGKVKMSQEMSAGDMTGVVEGMCALGSDVGKDVSELVEERLMRKKEDKAQKASA